MSDERSGSAIFDLLRNRINRREVLVGGGLLAVGSSIGCARTSDATDFTAIAGSAEDRVIVPDGFTADVVIRWGDPIGASDGLAIDRVGDGSLLEEAAAALQSEAFGASCDGMGVFPIDDDRLIVCVNHETPETTRMFPGWLEALRERRFSEFIQENSGAVAVMRASVGVSVVELRRDQDGWHYVRDSAFNRRITADTPIEFSGPAARHPWLDGDEDRIGSCLGTFGNCSAGATPWGTYLTAEENTNDYFGNGAQAQFEPLLARANARFGMRPGASFFRWEAADARFDHVQNPAECMKFGWIVEIDPRDPDSPVRKHTALGRLRHESATTVLNPSGRPVVYTGDDSSFEYFYKFVSSHRFDPDGRTDTLLEDGVLYVARLDEDGSGVWLPLVQGQGPLNEANGFASQADVVLRCREAADLLGATPLDRPEDVAVHPTSGRVYLACTQGFRRGGESDDEPLPGVDAANPRGPNPYGHILEFDEGDGDAASERFTWEVFILAGDPAADIAPSAAAGVLAPATAYYAGQTDPQGLSAFACPDNLSFDAAGNLWIVTDGSQPNGNNNGCFVCPTEGPDRGRVRQFLSGPVGAEISGCTFTPGDDTLFLTVQHPGSGSPIESPSSHWPDGGDSQPRSSLIAIRPVAPGSRFHI
jgi:secreted PhoX family phosphatase